jgi:hypothetical protein
MKDKETPLEVKFGKILDDISIYCDDCCYPVYRYEFKKRACLNIECPLYRYCPFKLTKEDIRKHREEVKNEQEDEDKAIKDLLSNQG